MDLLSLEEKLALADSLKASFRAGQTSFEQLDPYLRQYGRMPQRILSTTFSDVVKFSYDHVWKQNPPKTFQKYINRIYAKPFNKIGYLPLDGEAEDIKLQRQAYFSILYKYAKRPGVQRWLTKRGHQLLKAKERNKDTSFLQTELRWLALHAIIVQPKQAMAKRSFQRINRLLLQENDSAWRKTFISVLAQTPLEDHFEILLKNLPHLKKNEKISLFWSLMRNPIFKLKTWETFQSRYDEFAKEIPEGHLAYMPYLPTSFCDAEKIMEIQKFFSGKLESIPGAPRNARKAMDSITSCDSLRRKVTPEFHTFFGVNP